VIDPLFPARLHAGTPTVIVNDARGLPVRSLAFLRHPDAAEQPARLLRRRQCYNAAGQPHTAYGARALTGNRPDMTQVFALGGVPLLTNSVDAGSQLLQRACVTWRSS
jgi:insecticidal toxin complex protein TccC